MLVTKREEKKIRIHSNLCFNRIECTKIDALNAFALIVNVKLVIDNEIPSITRLIKLYFPINLEKSS